MAGTIVGASITLIADRVRWRRDQDQRHHQTRRDSYATYLAALHATSDAIRVVSLNEHDPQVSRVSAAVTAFGSAHLNAAREHVALVGPESVVHAADATFRSLRNLRDLLRQGPDLESSEYQQGLAQYQLTLYALRNVMRSDLGNTSIGKLMSHFEFRCDGLASGPESRTLLILSGRNHLPRSVRLFRLMAGCPPEAPWHPADCRSVFRAGRRSAGRRRCHARPARRQQGAPRRSGSAGRPRLPGP